MLITQIEGGLGSQMFGYAAARRLAIKHGVDVYIDTRAFRGYEKFQPELHHLDVDAILLTDEQADEICGKDNEKITVVRPAHLHVDHSILELDQSFLLMVGNFVSEDYFFDVKDVIRRDFTRVSEPTSYALAMQQTINDIKARGYEPVSVHVRRGDYVTEAHTNRSHGVCGTDYYERAFALINRIVDNPWFVIFSNDIEWVADNFKMPNSTIARPPRNTPPVEDMMLMASCRHHVIANSGYSFWGAWLGEHPEQVVIGPRPFIADRSINTEDIMLRHWISLNCTSALTSTEGK